MADSMGWRTWGSISRPLDAQFGDRIDRLTARRTGKRGAANSALQRIVGAADGQLALRGRQRIGITLLGLDELLLGKGKRSRRYRSIGPARTGCQAIAVPNSEPMP